MDESRYRLESWAEGDEVGLTNCFYEAYTQSGLEQAKFFMEICPDTPIMRNYYETSFAEQIRRGTGYAKKVVDTSSNNRIVAFSKWQLPNGPPDYWVTPAPIEDNPQRKEFFTALFAARDKHAGGIPHWFLLIMCVSPPYSGQGIGKWMMEEACALIDKEGAEAYVGASPAGSRLYAKHGFEIREQEGFPKPSGWYRESYMFRPAKKTA